MNLLSLASAMTDRRDVRYAGMACKIIAIALEDGSGHKFNITLVGPQSTTTVVFWDEQKTPCPIDQFNATK